MSICDKVVHYCHECDRNEKFTKVCTVGDKLASDQYHYDMVWLCQCDKCKTVITLVI